MLPRRLRRILRRLTRPFVSGLALAAYLLSVIGYPLAVPAARDTSTFPCQDHRCGCQSAEQCWTSCCCYSAEYRLAWARRHDVKVPHDVQVAMLGQSHERSDHGSSECCQPDAEGCCESVGHNCEKCSAPEKGTKLTWVYGFQAQKCRGITMLWVAQGATLPPAARELWQFDAADAGLVPIISDRYSFVVSPPPVPPPRM
jgi:hypothetical protein